jgi:hypothetical protein
MGIPNKLIQKWIDEWIISIEDVTEKAREVKRVLDGDREISREKMVEAGLVPEERVYEVSDELKKVLWMDKTEH